LEEAKQLDQACRSRWRLQVSVYQPEPVLSLFDLLTTFNALLRNLYRSLQRCASSSNFFIRSLQMSDAFYKSSFFLNYLTHMYDGD